MRCGHARSSAHAPGAHLRAQAGRRAAHRRCGAPDGQHREAAEENDWRTDHIAPGEGTGTRPREDRRRRTGTDHREHGDQRPRRHAGRWRAGDWQPQLPRGRRTRKRAPGCDSRAVRGDHHPRYRPWHVPGRPGACLRAVLHDQTRGWRDGAWSFHLLRRRQAGTGLHHRAEQRGARHHLYRVLAPGGRRTSRGPGGHRRRWLRGAPVPSCSSKTTRWFAR